MTPSTVRDNLKTALQSISGLRVFDYVPDSTNIPTNNAFAIVGQLNMNLLASSGSTSIKTAIEADKTLSGAVQTLRVVSASPGTITSANIDYLSYQYSVELIG